MMTAAVFVDMALSLGNRANTTTFELNGLQKEVVMEALISAYNVVIESRKIVLNE